VHCTTHWHSCTCQASCDTAMTVRSWTTPRNKQAALWPLTKRHCNVRCSNMWLHKHVQRLTHTHCRRLVSLQGCSCCRSHCAEAYSCTTVPSWAPAGAAVPVGAAFPQTTQNLQDRHLQNTRLQEATTLHYKAMLCSLLGWPRCTHNRCRAGQMEEHLAAHAALPRQLLRPAHTSQRPFAGACITCTAALLTAAPQSSLPCCSETHGNRNDTHRKHRTWQEQQQHRWWYPAQL
jgi:hypothetical protein